MKLSDKQIKLLNELKIRYDCVRLDIAVNDNPNRLSDDEYGALINQRLNQERIFFSKKHNVSTEDIIQMEKAYNELEDIDEFHQFLNYREICDWVFFSKLRKIIQKQVFLKSRSLGKSYVPEIVKTDAYRKSENEIERRVRKCKKVLERVIPQTTLYDFENIKYKLQYKIDHKEIDEKEFETEMIKELCEYAFMENYMNSKWWSIINRLSRLLFS